jgi:type II secretory pathway pseudopilin PulG
MHQRGFTVIEVILVSIVLFLIGMVFWQQFAVVKSAARDDTRRHAINAMHYNLEDVFYAKHKYYPKTINAKTLTAMDKELFTDPRGHKIGTADSNYRYEPTNCSNDQCKGYSLRALMEHEADFVKTNRER